MAFPSTSELPLHVFVQLLSPSAVVPQRANRTDAGYDLSSAETETVHLRPGERRVFKTGIAIQIPKGFYGRIAPRSGLAAKSGIDVLGGVIDSGYVGEVGVILLNTANADEYHWSGASLETVTVKPGDRIAQLIIERAYDASFIQVNELESSERGVGGFGSSGA